MLAGDIELRERDSFLIGVLFLEKRKA